jgi:hypothetical protein
MAWQLQFEFRAHKDDTAKDVEGLLGSRKRSKGLVVTSVPPRRRPRVEHVCSHAHAGRGWVGRGESALFAPHINIPPELA